eukprot:scaffold3240_cov179-Chaetoceros_neogracile.AAC.2
MWDFSLLWRRKSVRYYCYFGDGGGERYFSRTDINDVTNGSICSDPLSVILMGCNSGMLMSPNCPNGRLGPSCVVGNLVDVTDRDIDRNSVSLLEGVR